MFPLLFCFLSHFVIIMHQDNQQQLHIHECEITENLTCGEETQKENRKETKSLKRAIGSSYFKK